ncbi:alpha/beta fold hydrolase [Nocardioides sp. NPDC087217]|uniref:alpha/beta fold hydrolase n=1 Tax=Nocardioides sp. NPDC087217 TaxID=3364335 RepID=UPI003808250E
MKFTLRHSRALAATLVAILVTGSMLATTGSGASATGRTPDTTSQHGSTVGAKPTIVMVHGAWADASGWQQEVGELTDKGYPVIAPANPLRGLSSDAAYLRSILETIPGPVVLVGHSYGGAVMTNAATDLPNVKALVYVAAFAPDAHEPVAQLVQQFPGTLVTEDALDARPYPLPDGTSGVDLYLKASIFRDAFAGDLPRSTTTVMHASQRPFSLAAFTEPSGEPAWKTVPSWYLLATADKTIPPAAQEFMAKRAGAKIVRVRSSHVALQSHPRETLALIENAIRSIR